VNETSVDDTSTTTATRVDDRVLTLRDAASEFDIPLRTLSRWAKEGVLPVIRYKRQNYVSASVLGLVKAITRDTASQVRGNLEDRLVTTTEAARLLHCTPNRIRQLIERGKLPYVEFSNSGALIARSDIDAFINSSKQGGNEFIQLSDAARMVGYSVHAVRAWIEAGAIKGYKLGSGRTNAVLLERHSFITFVKSNKYIIKAHATEGSDKRIQAKRQAKGKRTTKVLHPAFISSRENIRTYWSMHRADPASADAFWQRIHPGKELPSSWVSRGGKKGIATLRARQTHQVTASERVESSVPTEPRMCIICRDEYVPGRYSQHSESKTHRQAASVLG